MLDDLGAMLEMHLFRDIRFQVVRAFGVVGEQSEVQEAQAVLRAEVCVRLDLYRLQVVPDAGRGISGHQHGFALAAAVDTAHAVVPELLLPLELLELSSLQVVFRLLRRGLGEGTVLSALQAVEALLYKTVRENFGLSISGLHLIHSAVIVDLPVVVVPRALQLSPGHGFGLRILLAKLLGGFLLDGDADGCPLVRLSLGRPGLGGELARHLQRLLERVLI